jgi:hypothetical protein
MNAPIIRGSQPALSVAPPSEDIPGLKAIHTKDQSGRTITTFEGSPRAWMNQFGAPTLRRVKSIRTRNRA